MNHRAANQDGFVMVIVIVVMGFAMLIGGVAVASTIQTRDLAQQDVRSKRAQQAADAGLSATIYRLNQLSLSNVNFSGGVGAVSQAIACQSILSLNTSLNLGFTDVQASTGACGAGKPAVPNGSFFDEKLGDRMSAKAYVTVGPKVIPSTTTTLAPSKLEPVVVSVGRDDNGTAADTSDDVIRRVRARLAPVDPFQALEATGKLTFDTQGLVTTTVLNGSARSNGDLSFSGGLLSTFVNTNVGVAPLSLTGSIAYQGGRNVTGLINVNLTTTNKATDPSQPPVSRRPVTVSPAKPDCPTTGCPMQYTASNHSLVASAGTVNLPGGDYVFCKVAITGSATLRPQPTANAPVRVYVDHPKSARCLGNAADPANGSTTVTGRIDPGVNLQPSQLQFYTAGPPAGVAENNPRTTALFDTTTSALSLLPGFFFYGPTTDVTLRYSTFQGNLIGHDLRLTASGVTNLGLLGGLVGNGTFTQDLNVNNLALSSQLGVFQALEYAQCTGVEVGVTNSTQNC